MTSYIFLFPDEYRVINVIDIRAAIFALYLDVCYYDEKDDPIFKKMIDATDYFTLDDLIIYYNRRVVEWSKQIKFIYQINDSNIIYS